MNDEQRIRVLEEELKVLKNEIKSVLLDLREQYLNIQNPFNASMAPNAGVSMGINMGPQVEKPVSAAPAKGPEEEISEAAYDEEQEQVSLGAGMDCAEEGPGNAPLDFANSAEMPGLNSGNGGFGMAPGLPSSDPLIGAGLGPSPSMGAGPGPALGLAQAENAGDEDDEDFIPQEAAQPSKGANKKKELSLSGGKTKYDLMVVAGLTQWIDQSTARLGKERAEALVEMSFTMGRLPENLKDALIKMVRITKNESNGHNVTASDYLSILAQLENLLGKSELQDNALLSLISMMKETGK